MWVSPRHKRYKPPETLDEKIEIFIAQVDGWHLEVADRCINGWQIEGRDCIEAVDLHGKRTKHIPDSGWAVLQIVLNYFEVIGYYKLGITDKNGRSGQRFRAGVLDVFPQLGNHSVNAPKLMWDHLRNGLYHLGVAGPIVLQHNEPLVDIQVDEQNQVVKIDPHVFVPTLRTHFRAYAERLRDPRETDVRRLFEEAFDEHHKLSQNRNST